jgi:hypothetical protein
MLTEEKLNEINDKLDHFPQYPFGCLSQIEVSSISKKALRHVNVTFLWRSSWITVGTLASAMIRVIW